MRCPRCGSMEDKVTDSRTLAAGDATRRRRECLSCGYRYTSYERIEEKPLMVIKADGRRQPFDRAKIERGVERSLEKRPVAVMAVERLVNEVEDAAVMAAGESREIRAQVIGEAVLDKLFELDRVAYIRFASVYRHFENLDEFVEEIKKLSKKRGKK
ncbi:MAG: transcriptional regulator NrdR [Spirochaetaceae bacterium]|nr:transcriptional regulator NrdR [Spirochaetaceae bacterium]